MKPFISKALLAFALIAPTALPAFQEHEKNEQTKRYYDARKKDYHEWNENENRAYERYLQEHRGYNHDFARLSKKQQEEYWTWRHEHPDEHR